MKRTNVSKDPQNCPYCQSEIKGMSDGWGLSPTGWEDMKDRHDREHTNETNNNP